MILRRCEGLGWSGSPYCMVMNYLISLTKTSGPVQICTSIVIMNNNRSTVPKNLFRESPLLLEGIEHQPILVEPNSGKHLGH